MEKIIELYRQEIAGYLEKKPEQIFLHWKGRVSLFAILKAMGVGIDDEVILPAWTCVVVPNAIQYLGAKPVYVDVDLKKFTIDVSQIEAAITSRTKVIICQNTYGLSPDITLIKKIAKRHTIPTIEDCAHGFGGSYCGSLNGTHCDAAFFSTQWNKPYSTGLGGIALINNSSLIPLMQKTEKEKVCPSIAESFMLQLLLLIRDRFLNERNYWTLINMYRYLSKYNLIIGSSSGGELKSTAMPARFYKGICRAQAKKGIQQLPKVEALISKRRENAALYSDFLMKNNKTFVDSSFFPNHSFLKYPLKVRDSSAFLKIAQQNNIMLGDWFVSPIHPVKESFALWGFDLNLFPAAKSISSKIVNLSTDSDNVDHTIKFLEKYSSYIE